MSIDWSKAPEGANYRDAGGNWLRFKNNQWFAWSSASNGYWFTIGKHNLQKPLTQKIVSTVADLIDLGYLESPTLHHQWFGRVYRLPPIGSTVRIDKGDRVIWDDAEMFIGVDVTLVAAFKTGDTQMVAVEHPVEKQCCCFRADMVRTLEQIADEARKETISKMLRYAAIAGESFRDVCGKMYDAGLRFEVTP